MLRSRASAVGLILTLGCVSAAALLSRRRWLAGSGRLVLSLALAVALIGGIKLSRTLWPSPYLNRAATMGTLWARGENWK